MADTRVQTLLILTLLHLCRGEINNDISESWYLATDGYKPKEYLSSESPFSTKPIVVLTDRPTNGLPSSELSQFKTSSRFPPQPPKVEITSYTEPTQPSSTLHDSIYLHDPVRHSTASPSSSTALPIDYETEPKGTITYWPPSSTPPSMSSSFVLYENQPAQGYDREQQGLFKTTPERLPTRRPDLHSTVSKQPTITTTLSPTTVLVSERPTTIGSTRLTKAPPIRSSTKSPPMHSGGNTTYENSFRQFPLRIRVVGPRGSITNVNVNPRILVKTTTTRKPTTRKTPKPKKNTYDACLNGCKARRDPICAVPLSATEVDPDKLKGFPSICHMACYNSYRKDPYEKLMDGRCGRLRTRIETFDSNVKIKRTELKKAQYFLEAEAKDQTVVEFLPIRHKK